MMLDQFLPGIRDIINGVKSPVEAFDECENNGVVEAHIKKRLAKLLEKLSEEDGDEITDYDKSPTESDTTEISFSKSFEEMLKHLREDDFQLDRIILYKEALKNECFFFIGSNRIAYTASISCSLSRSCVQGVNPSSFRNAFIWNTLASGRRSRIVRYIL